MRISGRIPTSLPVGPLESGGALTIDGFDDLVGRIVRLEVVEVEGRRFLELEAEVDEASRRAQLVSGDGRTWEVG